MFSPTSSRRTQPQAPAKPSVEQPAKAKLSLAQKARQQVTKVWNTPFDGLTALRSGVASALNIGGTFGAFGAINAAMRADKTRRLIPRVGALMPLPAAFASAYLDPYTQKISPNTTPSGDHVLPLNIIGSSGLILSSTLYALSKLPKFAPRTPQGMAATITCVSLGAGLGGVAKELTAQYLHHNAPNHADACPGAAQPAQKDGYEMGVNRALTQIPAVVLFQSMVTRLATKGVIPFGVTLAVPTTVALPYAWRDSLPSFFKTAAPQAESQANFQTASLSDEIADQILDKPASASSEFTRRRHRRTSYGNSNSYMRTSNRKRDPFSGSEWEQLKNSERLIKA